MFAWIIVCSFLGYGQLFYTMGFADPSTPSLEAFGQALVGIIDQVVLRSVLNRLWDLNLTLLSVNRIETAPDKR